MQFDTVKHSITCVKVFCWVDDGCGAKVRKLMDSAIYKEGSDRVYLCARHPDTNQYFYHEDQAWHIPVKHEGFEMEYVTKEVEF